MRQLPKVTTSKISNEINIKDNDNIIQVDGNVSLLDDTSESVTTLGQRNTKQKKHEIALHLPTVATYNVRSLFPKVGNFKIDMLERGISVAFISEIWEKSEDKEHIKHIETMLELDGLKYISTLRPNNKKGGGTAIIVNQDRFSVEKLEITIPNNLEVVWGLLKPKFKSFKFKKIILCSFYSPPKSRKNTKLADHIIGTLHMLNTVHPDSGIILGGDKNTMMEIISIWKL